jgi:Protein of unknown function (DUF2838)
MTEEQQVTSTTASTMAESNENGNDENEDHREWEPINTETPTELSLFQRQVSLQLDQLEEEATQADQAQAKVVKEEMEGILQAVEDLLKAEDDSVGSGDATPPTVQQRKESRLRMRRRLKAARDKVQHSLNAKLVKPVARASVHATRRVITGNKKTRIRDFVVLPKVVRVLDKYTFTGGVMGMLLTEFIMLQFPHFFRFYNVITMLPLLLLRVVLFHRTKQQYFL